MLLYFMNEFLVNFDIPNTEYSKHHVWPHFLNSSTLGLGLFLVKATPYAP